MLSLKVNGGLQDNKASESQQSDGHGPTFSCAKASSDATARHAIDPCELPSLAEQLHNGLAVYLRLWNYPLCTDSSTKLVRTDASNGVLNAVVSLDRHRSSVMIMIPPLEDVKAAIFKGYFGMSSVLQNGNTKAKLHFNMRDVLVVSSSLVCFRVLFPSMSWSAKFKSPSTFLMII